MKSPIIVKLLVYTILTVFAFSIKSVKAERMPSFDMDTCVGESKGIVQGTLDAAGELKVARVLNGALSGLPTLKLQQGAFEFESLQKRMDGKGPVEVVAFLEDQAGDEWGLALQYAGLVGFEKDAVFLEENDFGHNQRRKSAAYNRDTFFQALEDAMRVCGEGKRLISAPRSIERTRQLIAFALEHHQPNDPRDPFRPFRPNYHLGQVAAALDHPGDDEQGLILQALREAKTPREHIILLNLAERIPLRDNAPDAVALFLPPSHPPAVREAAMEALSRINGCRAVDYLAPYLVPDEPLLLTVLTNLGPRSFPPQDPRLNRKAVDALARLAQSIKESDQGKQVLQNIPGALSGQIAHYMHPRLLPVLYALALSGDAASCAQSFSDLQAATGLKYEQADKTSWEAWRKKAQPLLDGDLDLQTAAGLELWMERYAQADPATQRILMNLWFFEPTVDEAALIDSAERNEAAKKALAELWQRDRLSEAARKAIVQRFLSVKLVSQPPEEAKKDKSLYGVAVVVSSSFPFPQAAWMDNREVISFGPRAPAFQDENWGNWSLQDKGAEGLSRTDSVHAASPPQVRAILELRENGFPHSHDTPWTLTWNLGPIQLDNSTP